MSIKDNIANVQERMERMKKYKNVWTDEFLVIDYYQKKIKRLEEKLKKKKKNA